MDHALALVCLHQIHEHFAFGLHPLVEGQFDRCLHCTNSLRRSNLATAFFQDTVICSVPVDRRWRFHFAYGASWRIVCDQVLSIGQANVLRIAFDDFVNYTESFGLVCFYLAARGNKIKCSIHADQTRKSLCTTGTGNQTQMNLGQPHLGRGLSDAVMC